MKRALLPAILVVSLLLSALFAVRVPFGDNPDEVAHRDYIRLLIENHGFVKFTLPPPAAPAASGQQAIPPTPNDPTTPWETHQPPLYYLLCVPVHLASGGSVAAVRLVAALLQLLTIWVCWRAIRDQFPERDDLALGVAAFVAFLPTQAQLAGAINNDSLTTLLCAALFWRIGAVALRGQSVRDALWTGVLLGAGLWTKSTVLQLLPALVIGYAFAVRARKITAGEAAARFATVLGLGLVIALPWLIRNQMLYGDPLALSIYLQTGPNFTPAQMMQALGWSAADYARTTGVRTFVTFWDILPPGVLNPPKGLLLLTLVLALGGALGAYRWASRGGDDEAGERRVTGAWALGAALLVPFFIKFIFTTFQAQGRYFLPALLPVAAITLLGWAALTAARSRALGPALVAVVLLGLSVYQLTQQ